MAVPGLGVDVGDADVGPIVRDGLGRLVHAFLAEDGLDHVIGALAQLAERVDRFGWQSDRIGPDGWPVEGDDRRRDRAEVVPERGDLGCRCPRLPRS